jgi:CheY-like chemotaxis protein/HPt (histidine-containing phosphotransfer) domain-containing protein
MPDVTTASQQWILLAEEQAAARDLIVLVLGRLNYRIEHVATGRAALARARRESFDLILASASLPGMAGAALIGALRELPGLDKVPIVAICPDGGTQARQACMAAGAAAHLSRPLEIERLLGLIEQLLRRGQEARVSEPVLDLEHLHEFTDGDSQLEVELSTLFLSTAEMYLQGMHESLATGRSWASIAHALKGASANLGARRLAALAMLAERSEPTRAKLETIEHALEEVRTVFERRSPG